MVIEKCSNCGGETREGHKEDMTPGSSALLIPGACLWDMDSTGITAMEYFVEGEAENLCNITDG